MRRILFALAALAATAATIALLFVIVPLLGFVLNRVHGGWIWVPIGILMLLFALQLVRRNRS